MPDLVRESNVRQRPEHPKAKSGGWVLAINDPGLCRGLFKETLGARDFDIEPAVGLNLLVATGPL